MDGSNWRYVVGYVGFILFMLACIIILLVAEEFDARRARAEKKAGLAKELELGKGPHLEMRELAYQMLNGDVNVEDDRAAKLRPQLEALEDAIYQHRMSLCDRTGLAFEDADLEGIVSAYERLNRLCADGMYDHGWTDAAQEWKRVDGMILRTPKTRKTDPKA